jgi:glycosyltransferase involved in cell wall biosynthesis
LKIWFVSEVFDASGVTTGYYLARIAAALEHDYDVGVITDTKRGAHAGPRLEHLASSVAKRGIRTLLSSFVLATRALVKMRRGDIAIAVTNPPALPILMAVVAKLRHVRLVVVVHDVYPDILLAAQVWRRGGALARGFEFLNSWALSSADRVIVIGRDMQRRLASRLNGAAARIEYVPNWANEEIVVSARDIGKRDHPLLVQYSGNMGVTHGVESLIECAALLDGEYEEVRFELIGWGLKLPQIRSEIARRGLRNISLLPPAPRDQLSEQLGRCDLALILMIKGTAGASVPCRLYNIMAAGKPVIVAADADSEIATVVRDTRIGWVVEPEAPEQLASAIREARARAAELPEMGARARKAAADLYSFQRAASEYSRVIAAIAHPA